MRRRRKRKLGNGQELWEDRFSFWLLGPTVLVSLLKASVPNETWPFKALNYVSAELLKSAQQKSSWVWPVPQSTKWWSLALPRPKVPQTWWPEQNYLNICSFFKTRNLLLGNRHLLFFFLLWVPRWIYWEASEPLTCMGPCKGWETLGVRDCSRWGEETTLQSRGI